MYDSFPFAFQPRQRWSCIQCNGVRQWGYGPPEDHSFRPWLACGKCNAVTQHRYVDLAEMERRGATQ